MREDLGTTFERFVERKWQDALNVATAEPQPWQPEGPKRATTGKKAVEKAPQGHKGVDKAMGAANVVTQQPPPQGSIASMGGLSLGREKVSGAAADGV
jgi:hypothetical protein